MKASTVSSEEAKMQLPAWMWGVVLLCFCVAIFYRNKHKDDDNDDNEDRHHRHW